MSNKKQLPLEKLNSIAVFFNERYKSANLNKKSKKYEIEDFNNWMGVCATLEALDYKVPPIIQICMMSGRPITETILIT